MDDVQIAARLAPLGVLSEAITLPAGGTISEALETIGIGDSSNVPRLSVFLDGARISPQWWGRTRPKAGARILVNVVPAGGGGQGGKNPLQAIASIGIAIAVPHIAPVLGITSALGTTLLKAGLNLAVGALFGGLSSPPSLGNGATTRRTQAAESPIFNVTGIQNQSSPYGAVPNLYGTQRMFPLNAAKQFTRTQAGTQYIHALFCFGYGPILFSDFRIGQTPLSNFAGVEMEVRSGYDDDPAITLYPDQVNTQSIGVVLNAAAGERLFETHDNTDEAVVDFVFPGGLVKFNDEGLRQRQTVKFNVSYREADSTGPYITAGVRGTANVTSTLSTLESTGVNSFIRSLDNITAAAEATITLDTLTPDGTNNAHQYRIATRVEGETNFTQVASVLAAQQSDESNVAFTGQQFSMTGQISVAIAIPVGQRVEIQVATLTSAGEATAIVPSFDGLSYLRAGTGGVVEFAGGSAQTSFRDVRVVFPSRSRWEIRLFRVDPDATDIQVRDEGTVSQIKSYTMEAPISSDALGRYAFVALRIRASGQLSGALSQFAAVCTRLIPVWNGSTWTEPQEDGANNPAWCYADVYRGRANQKPIEDARFDTTTLAEWAADNDAVGFTFSHVFGNRNTVYQAASLIASVGFASPTFRDGNLFSVVINKLKTTPVQAITPRNASALQGEKVFADAPHALRVRFGSKEANYETVEVIVYDDNFDAANATEFQVLELPGVDNFPQAFRMARRFLASIRLRPESFTVNYDLEHLVATRGDMVRVLYDSIAVGLATARIKSMTDDGSGNITTITVDDEFVASNEETTYAIQIRRANGVMYDATITESGPANLTTVTPTDNIPAAFAPAVGDLVLFGVSGSVSSDMVITRISPRSDLSAQISLQAAAPGIFAADDDTIPPFDPNITVPVDPVQLRPPVPIIDAVQSDESVLLRAGDGSLDPRIVITFTLSDDGNSTPIFVESGFRISGADEFEPLPTQPASATTVIVDDVQTGEQFDIRVRTVDQVGAVSDYALVEGHTVVGATGKPPAPTDVRRENDLMRWSYSNPPIDFAGFKIRHRQGTTVQTTGSTLVGGTITETFFDLTQIADGSIRTVMVTAVDAQGNESDPGFVILNLGTPDPVNIVFTFSDSGANFPGLVTNGARVAGPALEAGDNGSLYLADANVAYLPDAGALYLPLMFGTMIYETDFTPPGAYPVEVLTVDSTIAADDVTIEYHGLGDGIYLSNEADIYLGGAGAAGDVYLETVPGFVQFPGSLQVTRQRFTFRITVAGGNVQGTVSKLDFVIDVPDVVETLEDIAIPAAGARLPISNIYRTIRFVSMTIQSQSGETATSLRLVDKDAALGPLINAFDSSNVATDATIDAEIRGL